MYYKTHELKTWPVFYKAIIDGSKTFEVRKNDRNFKVNDVLLLREYDPDAEQYTGSSTKRKVTYVLGDNPFFQLNKMVILGLQPIPQSAIPTDEQKQVFCDKLSDILMGVRLKNYITEDDDQMPLVDYLCQSLSKDISSGQEEIENIVEQVYFEIDDLFQSIHLQSSERDELIEAYKELTFVLNQLADYGENEDNTDKAFELRLKISELTKELGKK